MIDHHHRQHDNACAQPVRAPWPETACHRHGSATSHVPMTESQVRETCACLALDDEILAAFLAALPLFDDMPTAIGLFQCCLQELLDPGAPPAAVGTWRTMLPAVHPGAPMLHAFVFLAAVPEVRARHARRGIPEQITWDTLSDLGVWIREHRRRHGHWGLSEQAWLEHHFRSRLFRLGRLQFQLEPYPSHILAFRHRQGWPVILLAPGGVRFRPDGMFDGTNGLFDPLAAETVLTEDEHGWRGHPVSPEGRIANRIVRLRKPDWSRILAPGDDALSFHIPAIGPMAHQDCGESFRQAGQFFPKHVPDYAVKAYFSLSWLYDHQLDAYLPAESNIIRFQREFHLFPLPAANDHQILERVFGRHPVDLATAPRETSLQRIVASHVAAGRHWHEQGALLLPPEIPAWGSAAYRHAKPKPLGD